MELFIMRTECLILHCISPNQFDIFLPSKKNIAFQLESKCYQLAKPGKK